MKKKSSIVNIINAVSTDGKVKSQKLMYQDKNLLKRYKLKEIKI